jgi:DNA gyrase/topoisomerase IV subunit A
VKKAEEEGLEKRFRLVNQISTSNMVCFDLNGKIKKYTSPEEILEDFYEKRLEYYGIRKVCLLCDYLIRCVSGLKFLTFSNTWQMS